MTEQTIAELTEEYISVLKASCKAFVVLVAYERAEAKGGRASITVDQEAFAASPMLGAALAAGCENRARKIKIAACEVAGIKPRDLGLEDAS